MSTLSDVTVVIRPVPPGTAYPAGKVADAEIHFHSGPLKGLRLIGFAIWKSRYSNGGGPAYNVTMPSRPYAVNGERRSYALLRNQEEGEGSPDMLTGLKQQILDVFQGQATQLPKPVEPALVQALKDLL